ncbi:2875_t:CDS:2, partial [Ambispora leptoticha]
IINVYRNKLQAIQTPLSAFAKSKEEGAHEFINGQNINTSQVDQLIYLNIEPARTRSAILYNSVIIGFAEQRNTAIVEKLWNSMLKDNNIPDVHSFCDC